MRHTNVAQGERRTLLIDADLRRPGLTKLMGLRAASGLSDLLRSDGDMTSVCDELIQPSGIGGLDVLASGPRPVDPAVLLSRPRMAELIAWAEQHYDQILIDCPPVLAATDAALIGRLVDGVALVVQPQKNHRRIVIRATESLRNLKVNLVGIVANLPDDSLDLAPIRTPAKASTAPLGCTRSEHPTSYSKMAPEETAPSISSSYVLSKCSKPLGRDSRSHCSRIRKTKPGRSQIAAISGRERGKTAETSQVPRSATNLLPLPKRSTPPTPV